MKSPLVDSRRAPSGKHIETRRETPRRRATDTSVVALPRASVARRSEPLPDALAAISDARALGGFTSDDVGGRKAQALLSMWCCSSPRSYAELRARSAFPQSFLCHVCHARFCSRVRRRVCSGCVVRVVCACASVAACLPSSLCALSVLETPHLARVEPLRARVRESSDAFCFLARSIQVRQ